jgi:hypothetical protein
MKTLATFAALFCAITAVGAAAVSTDNTTSYANLTDTEFMALMDALDQENSTAPANLTAEVSAALRRRCPHPKKGTVHSGVSASVCAGPRIHSF